MKNKLTKATLTGALGMAALGIMSVSAMGFPGMNTQTPDEIATRQQTMFQEQATMLGLSVDDIKTAWASGKDLKTLATEKGIDMTVVKQKMEAKRLTDQKTMLSTLVTKGVITQAQADQRLATMSTQKAKGGKGEGKHGGRGFGMFGL